MTSKPEKADDDIDALEALESEEKEYLKVRHHPSSSLK
jgi:DnaJ family protein C protein 8